MIYVILAVLLLVIGGFLTLVFLMDLPSKESFKISKTVPLVLGVCLTIGFGLHFLLLSLGI